MKEIENLIIEKADRQDLTYMKDFNGRAYALMNEDWIGYFDTLDEIIEFLGISNEERRAYNKGVASVWEAIFKVTPRLGDYTLLYNAVHGMENYPNGFNVKIYSISENDVLSYIMADICLKNIERICKEKKIQKIELNNNEIGEIVKSFSDYLNKNRE